MFCQKTIPILEIIRSIFWLPIPGSRNSILNWVLKLNHLLRSQSSLQALKPFFLGISNEMIFKIIKFRNKMACFITYMIPVWYLILKENSGCGVMHFRICCRFVSLLRSIIDLLFFWMLILHSRLRKSTSFV